MNTLTQSEAKVKRKMKKYLSILERHLQYVRLANNLFSLSPGKGYHSESSLKDCLELRVR